MRLFSRKSKHRRRHQNTTEMDRLRAELTNLQQFNADRLREIENMRTNQTHALEALKNSAEQAKKELKQEYEQKEKEKKEANDRQMADLKVKRLFEIINS